MKEATSYIVIIKDLTVNKNQLRNRNNSTGGKGTYWANGGKSFVEICKKPTKIAFRRKETWQVQQTKHDKIKLKT